MHRLLVNPGTPLAWEIHLKPGSNYIGRGAANDFTINDSSVSSSHCQVIVDGDVICIKDLESTNGTRVDGRPIREALIKAGQRIQLGSVEVLCETRQPSPAVINLSAIARMEPPPPASPRAVVAVPAALMQTAPAASASAMPMPFVAVKGPLLPQSPVIAPPTTASATAPALSKATSVVATASSAATSTTPSPGTATIIETTPVFCKNHHKNPGRYKCEKCNRYFCDLCVNTRGSASGGLKACKICGDFCSTVSIESHVPKAVDFFKSVRPAFRYPFQNDGRVLLICGALFFAALDTANYISLYAGKYAMRAMMMRSVVIIMIFGTGYLFSYLTKIIHATADGDQRIPDWPEFTEWQGDIVAPMFQFMMVSVLSFGPALALGIWMDWEQMWLVWLALLAGCYYFPMAMLGVAMFDTIKAALNPLFVIASILRVPREYAVASGIFAGIVLIRWLMESVLKMILPIPLVPALIADLIGIYFLIVETRILGLLYYSRKDVLRWFEKRQMNSTGDANAAA